MRKYLTGALLPVMFVTRDRRLERFLGLDRTCQDRGKLQDRVRLKRAASGGVDSVSSCGYRRKHAGLSRKERDRCFDLDQCRL